MEAFLSHESLSFSKLYANTANALQQMNLYVVLRLLIFALNKGPAFIAEKVLTWLEDKGGTTQP
jgi:hypothetical protein